MAASARRTVWSCMFGTKEVLFEEAEKDKTNDCGLEYFDLFITEGEVRT